MTNAVESLFRAVAEKRGAQLAVGVVLLGLLALRKLGHERQHHEVARMERPAAQPAVQLRIDLGELLEARRRNDQDLRTGGLDDDRKC